MARLIGPAAWGYGPSGVVGLLVLAMLTLVLMGLYLTRPPAQPGQSQRSPSPAKGTGPAATAFPSQPKQRRHPMKGILAWLIGIPIPIIIILYLLDVF